VINALGRRASRGSAFCITDFCLVTIDSLGHRDKMIVAGSGLLDMPPVIS
jgi:hypothetical protein